MLIPFAWRQASGHATIVYVVPNSWRSSLTTRLPQLMKQIRSRSHIQLSPGAQLEQLKYLSQSLNPRAVLVF